jgi:hypothetical protein
MTPKDLFSPNGYFGAHGKDLYYYTDGMVIATFFDEATADWAADLFNAATTIQTLENSHDD